MVETTGNQVPPGRAGRWADWNNALDAALAEARSALAEGDTPRAERLAKAVSAMAKAARDTAELENYARDQPLEDDVETVRAELRRRIARFVEAHDSGADLETLERIGSGELP